MSDSVAALLTCPDCGGILESSRPAWSSALDLERPAPGDEDRPAVWRCLICGYHRTWDAPEADQSPGSLLIS